MSKWIPTMSKRQARFMREIGATSMSATTKPAGCGKPVNTGKGDTVPCGSLSGNFTVYCPACGSSVLFALAKQDREKQKGIVE